MSRSIKLVLLLTVSLVVLSAGSAFIIKRDAAINIFAYLFFDGPYTSRTIRHDKIVLEPQTDLYNSVVFNPDFEDPHWFSINLNSLKSKLQGKEKSIEIRNFVSFIDDYNTLLSKELKASSGLSDSLAEGMMSLVNAQFRRNRDNKRQISSADEGKIFADPQHHSEYFIWYLVNRKTACGTVGEATLALMRKAGFKTRLLGIANDPKSIVYNHVFLEYYSEEQDKWVMMDPMINAIPRSSDQSLSVLEMLGDEKSRSRMNDMWWKLGDYEGLFGPQVYRSDRVVFFNNAGPWKKTYYFTVDDKIRSTLKGLIAAGG